MNRRKFLTGAGAVALSSSLAGCGMGGGTAPPQTGTGNNSTGNQTQGMAPPVINPQQYAGAFDEVVNMVEAGADPTGKEDVSPVIQEEIGSNTLLVFPQGTYKMNSQVRRVGLENLGIVGQGAVLKHGRVDAIEAFDVTEGEFHGPAQHFKIGNEDTPHQGKFVFGGFIADWRKEDTGMQLLYHNTSGQSIIENVKAVGIHALGCQGPFRLNPATESSEILARNIDIRHGGKTYQHTINSRETHSLGGRYGRSLSTTGIVGHPSMRGKLTIQNALCGGWPDNGIYAIGGMDTNSGTVNVINCVSANSQASNIRVGGQNSTVQNCVVITDNDFSKEGFYFEQRPIRLDQGSVTVENTSIIQKVPTGRSLSVLHGVDKATIEHVSITIHDTPTPALVISPDARNVRVKDVSIETPGWDATPGVVLRNGGAQLSDIRLNGAEIA